MGIFNEERTAGLSRAVLLQVIMYQGIIASIKHIRRHLVGGYNVQVRVQKLAATIIH